MQVQVIKMRHSGVAIDRRTLGQAVAQRGLLVVLDVTDQGLRRPCKVARLLHGETVRSELADVHILWLNERRMALTGFERGRNESGRPVDYAQSWLVTFEESGLVTAPANR